MKAMTVTEFRQRTKDLLAQKPRWRYGQTAFNFAVVYQFDEAFSVWADQMRLSDVDPYHDDTKVDEFIAAAVRAGHLSEGS